MGRSDPKSRVMACTASSECTGTMSCGRPVLTSCAGRPVVKISCGLRPNPWASRRTSSSSKMARNCGVCCVIVTWVTASPVQDDSQRVATKRCLGKHINLHKTQRRHDLKVLLPSPHPDPLPRGEGTSAAQVAACHSLSRWEKAGVEGWRHLRLHIVQQLLPPALEGGGENLHHLVNLPLRDAKWGGEGDRIQNGPADEPTFEGQLGDQRPGCPDGLETLLGRLIADEFDASD